MNKNLDIQKRKINEDTPCFIVAEIGANHNNQIELAYRLIDLSIEAGADAVKFQSYKAETLYSKYVPRKDLGGGKLGPEIYPMIQKIQMPYDWHAPLKDYCDRNRTIFLSTPFDLEAVDSLEKVGVPAYKIASSEIGDPILLRRIARTRKPIILSTGKANLEEVEAAVHWIQDEGNNQIILLHCTVSYPAVYKSMNLRAMLTLKSHFDCLVGLSDHNAENITAVAATALGAKVIEKHITLDRSMEGPDHAYALQPREFAQLVTWVRNTEIALGDGVKKMDPSESEGKRLGNRSIHVRKSLPVGHVLTEADLVIKRPSLGISPREFESVLGRRVSRPVLEDMWLTWDDL